ncbi:MAG: PAS domain S-box protein [Anaerolineaceae bacterium]|nr:PAS domain S-box protein [Anaerolineaceae bacterium]
MPPVFKRNLVLIFLATFLSIGFLEALWHILDDAGVQAHWNVFALVGVPLFTTLAAYYGFRSYARLLTANDREVSQRRRIEQTLRQKEKQYQGMIANTYDGIALMDDQLRVVEWNQGMETITGMQRPDVVGRFIWDVQYEMMVPEKKSPQFYAMAKEQTAAMVNVKSDSEVVYQGEIEIQSLDGARKVIQLLVYSIQSEQGVVIFNIVHDITERRHMEERMRQMNSELRALFESSPVGILSLDGAFHIKTCNPEAGRIFGWDTRQVAGRPLMAGIPDLPDHVPAASRLEDLPWQTLSFESRAQRSSGEAFRLRAQVAPQAGPQGEITGFIIIVQDVTRQYAAEQALRDSEERYRVLVETSPEAILMLDTRGRILFANQQTAVLHGFASAEALNKYSARKLIAPQEIVRSRKLFMNALKTGSLRNLEIVLKRQDGSPFHAEMNATVLRSPEGKPLGTICMMRDISQRKQTEEELENYRRHLEEIVAERTNELKVVNAHLQEEVLEREQAERGLRQRALELETLVKVSSALRKVKSRRDMAGIIAQETLRVMDAVTAAVFLREEDSLELIGVAGLAVPYLGRQQAGAEDCPFWSVYRKGKPLHLHCVQIQAKYAQCELLQGVSCGLALPLSTAEADVGVLFVGFSQPNCPLSSAPQAPADLEVVKGLHYRILGAIAEMAGSALNRVSTMETLEKRVVERTRYLSTLYGVTSITSEPLNLQVILGKTLEQAMGVVQSSRGLILLLDEEGGLFIAAQRGLRLEELSAMKQQSFESDLWAAAEVLSEVKVITNLAGSLSSLRSLPLPPGGMVSAPIRADGRPHGALVLFSERVESHKAEDIGLLAAIADQIGVAVLNARLHQQAEHSAVMEERQRLARELHDSVTQSLYSVTLMAETGKRLMRGDNHSGTEAVLEQLGDTAQQSLREMRLLVYELRPKVLESEGLLGAIQQRLDTVEQRSGVQARMIVEGDYSALVTRLKALDVEQELYRIVQEALNNALKHARAANVAVILRADPAALDLEVKDDGCGFEMSQLAENRGVGMSSMQERIQRLGGRLEIQSSPGEGTRVQAWVPMPAPAAGGVEMPKWRTE